MAETDHGMSRPGAADYLKAYGAAPPASPGPPVILEVGGPCQVCKAPASPGQINQVRGNPYNGMVVVCPPCAEKADGLDAIEF